MLAEVLPQCPKLTRLLLGKNRIANEEARLLTRVLTQCPGLGHLELYDNSIGGEGLLSLRVADLTFYLGTQDTRYQESGTFDMILEEMWESMHDGGH